VGELTQFRRRVLLVDSDSAFLAECMQAFGENEYEALSASDGFEALQVLRGGLPDLLVVELDLPRMSGFEFLSIVRARFPQLGVIAVSDTYGAQTLPAGTICDAFVPKGPNSIFEAIEASRNIVTHSPIRASLAQEGRFAPVWVPRSASRYVIVTCPECLRSFSVSQREGEEGVPLREACFSCGAEVRFYISGSNVQPHAPHGSTTSERAQAIAQQARLATSTSEDAIADSRKILDKIRRRA
jgi:CheY-like chemotaxis protein